MCQEVSPELVGHSSLNHQEETWQSVQLMNHHDLNERQLNKLQEKWVGGGI